MTGITIKRQVAAPRERVFAAATDFANAASFIQAIDKIEMLTEGPVGVGTRFRETRIVFGRPATEEMKVTGFDPPGSYTLTAESHGARYETVFSFAEKSGGTEVEMRFAVTPLTFMAKVMGFLMRPMMKKMLAMCAKDLEDIAKAVESEALSSPKA
ncbi:MAG TPA: SRPBCC family protein [Thermoanaerobaculia bacterium]|nr:SRPBCC family protein [Thermoanaerobaculia bacterium]